jgi:catechol-2,3-dioxygenase
MRAIVNGHDVQPTEAQLKAIGHLDMTTSEAEEVSKLYNQLMQNSHANR